MNSKLNFSEKCMIVTPKIFRIVLILLGLFLCVASWVLPSERKKMEFDCTEFETEWYHVRDNGEMVLVQVPGKVPAQRGEPVTLMTTLPKEIRSGETIFFRPVMQDVDIYIDGKLRLHYDTKASRPFGENSVFRYLPVELEEEDAGKTLTYQLTSQSKYSGTIRKIYIGNADSIWLYLMKEYGVNAMVALVLLLASILCIIVCAILRLIYKRQMEMRYLAWSVLLCALWMLSEVEFRQLWLENVSVMANTSYWSLMLIPIPLLLYMNALQKGRYKKPYSIAITYSTILFLIGTVLQVFDIVQFTEQLPFVHVGIIFTIVNISVTIFLDIYKKRIKHYRIAGVGICGFLLLSVLEVILYYIQVKIYRGTFLTIGLMFLLIMGFIKGAFDFLQSERKKQQAISAKEAEEKFLANMSHEIRTPMNAIVGMTEILLRGDLTEEQREYLNNIKSSGNALVSIINDILDISKIEAGKMELVDDVYATRPMFDDIRKIIQTRIGDKPIELLCEIDETVPDRLYGDGLRIRQIIINLMNNAVKFTERGHIKITVKAEPLEDGRLAVFVSVADTGQGIRQEDIKRLFSAFQQVDAVKNKGKEGTGLGLTISAQLVEMMGGKLEVRSEYGKGSEFYFTIYQKTVSEDMVWKQEAEDEIMNFIAPDAKILLVDDNEMNRKVAVGLLEPLQLQIDTAANGKEALSKIGQKEYDLVFMDHMMPVMDGIEATGRLREMEGDYYQKLPVIALTANAMKEAQKLFLESGMNGFVAKPIVMKEICQALREWLSEDLIIVQSDESVAAKADKGKQAAQAGEALKADVLQTDEVLQVEGIDVKEGIKNMGSKEFLLELLGDYCILIDSKALKIEKYLEDDRIRDYTIEVHALKSASRMIGATELSERFRYLEELGNAGDMEKIMEETPKVLELYRSYKTYLAPFAAKQEMEKKEVPKEEVLLYLRGIQQAIEGFDLDTADEAMKKLEECRLPEECIPMLEELRPLFADVAMEEIVAITGKMIEVMEGK